MREPKIPMSPAELPQMNRGPVQLPPRPDHFVPTVCVGREAFPEEVTTATEPAEAIYLAYVEWSWSPMHSRIDAYYLSLADEHWLLWLRQLDDGDDPWRWDWAPYAYCRSEGIGPRTAAVHLLQEAWSFEADDYLRRYHFISEVGDLSEDEVEAIADRVWGSEDEASGAEAG